MGTALARPARLLKIAACPLWHPLPLSFLLLLSFSSSFGSGRTVRVLCVLSREYYCVLFSFNIIFIVIRWFGLWYGCSFHRSVAHCPTRRAPRCQISCTATMDSMNSIIDIKALGHYYNAKDQACQNWDKMNANLRLTFVQNL